MSDKTTARKGEEEARSEEPQGFAEMCRQIMGGEVPDCCGPQMREMMSRWMAERQAKEGK